MVDYFTHFLSYFISLKAEVDRSILQWLCLQILGLQAPCVIRPFNFCLKSKIENWCQIFDFFQFCYKKKIWKCQIENIWHFFLLVEYWNITHIFTLILSTMRRKIKLSGNFASPTMLQSVGWLSFSVFGGSLNFLNVIRVITVCSLLSLWPSFQ